VACEPPQWILHPRHKHLSIFVPRALCQACYSTLIGCGQIQAEWYTKLSSTRMTALRAEYAYSGWCDAKED